MEEGLSVSMESGRWAVLAGIGMVLVTGLWAPAQAQPVPYARPVVAPLPQPASIVLSQQQAQDLRQALDGAEVHGLSPADYRVVSRDDAALVAATLRYARAVRTGRLKASGFRKDWGLRPAAYDPAPELARAVADNSVKAWLDGLPPPYPGYEALQRGLKQYRKTQAEGGWRPLPAVDLAVGASGPLVAALRARLVLEDPRTPPLAVVPPPLPGTVPVAGALPAGTALYDEALGEAVKRAQRRFGLQPTGGLNLATRTALNVPVERRIEQIQANMERWRWLPRTLPAHRIQVNIAAAVLAVFENDAPTLTMRAVTGRPGHETPMLQSSIHSIVLNPPWNVPSGIAAAELWPKGRAYLASAGFRIIPTEGGGSRLQQAPGPDSALGLIKFDFDNPYAVYLHDTPSKGRFASYSRLASHGCVRLEKPLALARHVMAGDAYWTPEQIDAVIAEGKTVRADLARPIDVFLLYWTGFMTPDGAMSFRADPYGWDSLLMQRIAAQGVAA
jgi:murein L,D-transpeptidase YcbB/YkuD